MEAKILGADERARNLEYSLFQKLREETLTELGPLQKPRLRSRLWMRFARWQRQRGCSITAGRNWTSRSG